MDESPPPDIPVLPPGATDEVGEPEPAKLVGSPREAEQIPDLEAAAARLRHYWDAAASRIDRSRKGTLQCLALTRGFLEQARRHPTEFRTLSARRGITRGRTETRVLRWFMDFSGTKGDSTVNRWADALSWFETRTAGLPLAAAIRKATKVGGLTAIAELGHARRCAEKTVETAIAVDDDEPPTLLEEADSVIELREPVSLDRQCKKDTVSLYVVRERLGCMPEFYGPINNENLLRRAMKLLQ